MADSHLINLSIEIARYIKDSQVTLLLRYTALRIINANRQSCVYIYDTELGNIFAMKK